MQVGSAPTRTSVRACHAHRPGTLFALHFHIACKLAQSRHTFSAMPANVGSVADSTMRQCPAAPRASVTVMSVEWYLGHTH